MASSNAITSSLQNYLGENSADLLRIAYNSMDVWNDVTVLPDVKNKLRLTTLLIDNIVKPFTSTFSASNDVIKFIPREIGVDVAKADLLLDPEAYRQTYLAQFQKKGVTRSPDDLPFEQYVWEQIFEKFGAELNDTTAYFGSRNASGTSAADVTDGYGKILAALITATKVTPKSIGALDPETAIEQLKELYRSVPAPFQRPQTGLKAYMSKASYNAYEDNLENKGYNQGRGDDMLKPKWLRGAEGICELKPVTWMGSSERIIMTPQQNIILAADATDQDLAKANIVPDVWTAKVGIACALGFNFRYEGLIFCNETI